MPCRFFLKISKAYGQDHKDQPFEKINIIPVVIIIKANLRALLTVKETINTHFFFITFGSISTTLTPLRVLMTTVSSFLF